MVEAVLTRKLDKGVEPECRRFGSPAVRSIGNVVRRTDWRGLNRGFTGNLNRNHAEEAPLAGHAFQGLRAHSLKLDP